MLVLPKMVTAGLFGLCGKFGLFLQVFGRFKIEQEIGH